MAARLRDVPDFPRPGILFKDLTPLLADPELFPRVIHALAAPWRALPVQRVVGVEARGFLFGAPLALALGCGFAPARKRGKLPARVVREAYGLEYGEDVLELHEDALAPGDRVLVVDDVLATGGTAAAAARLVARLGAEVAGFSFALALEGLGGRARLGAGAPVHALLSVP
jgi:adenine phosphoribosyltransferase